MKINITKYSILLLQTIIILIFSINNGYSQTAKDSERWQKHDIQILSFSDPSELKFKSGVGHDSQTWRYDSPKFELMIGLGVYEGKPEKSRNEQNYTEKSVIIDQKEATIVFSEYTDRESGEFKYVAALFFTEVISGEDKLRFVAYCKTPEEQKIAEKIFLSIKFN
jgi:hypothetical protein